MSEPFPPIRALRMTPERREFFDEMTDSSRLPDGSEPWQNFDPPFPRALLRPLEVANIIETRNEGRHAEHRFMPGGRSRAIVSLRASATLSPAGEVSRG